MTEEERQAAIIREWIASRPEAIRKLAEEFPLFTGYEVGGKKYILCGWREPDLLILFPHDAEGTPEQNPELRQYVHADCVRKFRGDIQ